MMIRHSFSRVLKRSLLLTSGRSLFSGVAMLKDSDVISQNEIDMILGNDPTEASITKKE